MLDETPESNLPALRVDFDPAAATPAELVEFNANARVPAPADERARILDALSHGREFHPRDVARETRQHLENMGRAMWEAGRRMAWAREVLDANAWVLWIENEVGVGRSTAYRYMKTALAFAPIGGPSPRMLDQKMSAIVEMAAHLETDELQLVEEGGEVEGVGTLDDIARMSLRQLKKRLREREKDVKAEQELRTTAQRKLEAAHAELDQIRLGKSGDDEARLAEVAGVENDLVIGLNKTMAWLTRQDWPAATPALRAKGAGLMAQVTLFVRDLRVEMERMGCDDLLVSQVHTIRDSQDLISDLKEALDPHIGAAGGEDTFTVDEVCRGRFGGTPWDEPIVGEVLASLRDQKIVGELDGGRWRWLGFPDYTDFEVVGGDDQGDDDNVVRPDWA